MSSLLKGKRG